MVGAHPVGFMKHNMEFLGDGFQISFSRAEEDSIQLDERYFSDGVAQNHQ